MQKVAGRAGPQLEGASLAQTCDGYQEYQQPLPAFPLHAKVVVFELQCPASIRIWRSAAPRILHYFCLYIFHDDTWNKEEGHHLLARVPALQPYFVEPQKPPSLVQIHFAYFHPKGSQSRNDPILRYVVQYPIARHGADLSTWQPVTYRQPSFGFDQYPSCRDLKKYVDHTSHAPNDVLSAQADCPADLSLDEFVAFAHLRSGGSLQWLNILQGLRSRTLNFRRHQVHYLLAHAAFQVGPLDLNTGTWIWHQELQDSCFCNALLDELDSLIMDIRACSIDGVLMSTVSLLLTRVLASSPSAGVSVRALVLLRSVRRKTFSWVQGLSYDLAQSPTNEERRDRLLDMAATCRSTFDVDRAILHKVFYSAEDVDTLLSCAFFIHALRPKCMFNS